jgi:hypothetical protein
MTGTGGDREKLPKYDFVVIPLLAVLTLVVLFGAGEVASRALFVESGAETCNMIGGAGVSVMRPDCTSYRKSAEGPETVNRYNDCGYRSPDPCRDRRPGAIRVALMGASTAQGLKVPYEATFAARLTRSLSQACGRPVEFQNMGVAGAGLLDIYRRTDEALAMRPDLILVVLTPYELKAMIPASRMAARDLPLVPAAAGNRGRDTTPSAKSLVARISDAAFDSRMLVVAQHFLFEDRATFVSLFMLHGEDADYLRLPYSPGWEQRLGDVDTLLGAMATRAKAAGVTMMLALGPQRIQAALLDRTVLPQGVDPFAIGRRLGEIAARHDMLFQDALEGFAAVKDPDALFYAVDGHMDGEGNGVFAASILGRLTRDDAAFRGCLGATVAGG